jgi:hypothetical protein
MLLQKSKDIKKTEKKKKQHNLSIAQPGCVSTIMIIRHCEKDDNDDANEGDEDSDVDDNYSTTGKKTTGTSSRHCSTIGYERAQYIQTLFGNTSTTGDDDESSRWPIPQSIYALTLHRTDHMNYREYETVVPLATKYNISIEMTTRILVISELYDLLNTGQLCNQVAVICWKHSHIPELANNLGCSSKQGCPNHYNPYQYDNIYTLQFVLQQQQQQQNQQQQQQTTVVDNNMSEQDISFYNANEYLKDEVDIIYQAEKKKAEKEAQKEKDQLKKLMKQQAANNNITTTTSNNNNNNNTQSRYLKQQEQIIKKQQQQSPINTTILSVDNSNATTSTINNTGTTPIDGIVVAPVPVPSGTNNNPTKEQKPVPVTVTTATTTTTTTNENPSQSGEALSDDNISTPDEENDEEDNTSDDSIDNNSNNNTNQTDDGLTNNEQNNEIDLPVYLWTVYGSVQYQNFVPKGKEK